MSSNFIKDNQYQTLNALE